MPPTNAPKTKTAPAPKTLAEQIAALPALTSYAPYREVRERDQSLARDRQKLMEERAVVLAEMEKYPGLADMKLEDLEPMKLAGLDTEEMRYGRTWPSGSPGSTRRRPSWIAPGSYSPRS